ncbi:hypothetical protein WUBG_10028, partial [Wuchereria bancrofti]
MSPVAVIHTAFPKKDADESPRVKVVEIENKGSSKINKENRSIASELNTLKD